MTSGSRHERVNAPYFIADDIDPDTVYITVPYAALCIDAPRIRIYNWIGKGLLRTRHDGQRILVSYTDILKVLDATRPRRERWHACQRRPVD